MGSGVYVDSGATQFDVLQEAQLEKDNAEQELQQVLQVRLTLTQPCGASIAVSTRNCKQLRKWAQPKHAHDLIDLDCSFSASTGMPA